MPWRVDVENRNLEIMVPPRQRIDGRVELVDIPKRVVVEPRHAAAAPEAKHGDRQGSAAQRCQRQDAHTPCSHAIQLRDGVGEDADEAVGELVGGLGREEQRVDVVVEAEIIGAGADDVE